jgi:hypothetical protein
MGRFSALMLALLLGGASAIALVSCGGDSDAKLLPGKTAEQIESNLDQVKLLVESGDCIGAEDAVAEVSAEVEELNTVAVKLKDALQEGTARLSEVVGRCEEEAPEEETVPSRESEEDVEAEELEDQEAEAEDLEAEEKAAEKAEKLEEKEEEQAEATEDEEKALPPQANGEAKGHEEVAPPVTPAPTPAPVEEAPSGGVTPGVGVK